MKMSYIPMFKNKEHEENVIRTYNNYFYDEIIPLIEIIKRKEQVDYLRDEEGKVVRRNIPGLTPHGRQRTTMLRDERTRRDVTIQRIQECLGGQEAFIDFFRFFPQVYGNDIHESMNWSLGISRNWEEYTRCFNETNQAANLYPVVTFKENIDILENQTNPLINR
jgi:hypothetical protein